MASFSYLSDSFNPQFFWVNLVAHKHLSWGHFLVSSNLVAIQYSPELWHDEISTFEWCYFRGKVKEKQSTLL
jgi:hypothetical protein